MSDLSAWPPRIENRVTRPREMRYPFYAETRYECSCGAEITLVDAFDFAPADDAPLSDRHLRFQHGSNREAVQSALKSLKAPRGKPRKLKGPRNDRAEAHKEEA